MAGLYLHIPFCKQACHYCDFHFSTDDRRMPELCKAIVDELTLQTNYLTEPVSTLYLGGGTPSLLKHHEIDTLFKAIQTNFTMTSDTEFTLEANPDDLSKEKLKGFREVGINRLSIGIQSFDQSILKFLNRAHDDITAKQCLDDVREAGFVNVSIDLIYAIPGLSNRAWTETLKQAIQFSPEHISSYALTIEHKTVFGNWSKRGKLQPMDEESAAEQFEILMDVLGNEGYEHYEISNFCKPGFHSKHNSSYWKQSPYLGIGPSAHSYDGTSRQSNVRNNEAYLRSIGQGIIPFEREILTLENKINEYILTTLRTMWGCDLLYLKQYLNDDLFQRRHEYISQIEAQGFVTLESGKLTLTRKGKLLADKIIEDLIVGN